MGEFDSDCTGSSQDKVSRALTGASQERTNSKRIPQEHSNDKSLASSILMSTRASFVGIKRIKALKSVFFSRTWRLDDVVEVSV